jgi:cytochrome c
MALLKPITWLMWLLTLAACTPNTTPPVGNATAGQKAFTPCASCHAVGPSARSVFGPQLNGVLGRHAGSAPEYAYSAAMKNANIIWTEQSLAAFIQDPDGTVPGTKMRFLSWGYDDQKIADLLAYLRTFSAVP